MKNFGRALADALGFWPLLLVATLCAVGNGAIWGLNIGALFPVIKVTMVGESLQDWVKGEIAESHVRIAKIDREIADLRANVKPGSEREIELELLQSRKNAEQAGLDSSLKIQPYIDRYMPQDPFQTVLYVMLGVLFCTALKHVFQFANTAIVALIAARITRRIQTRIFSKALTLDPASFAGHTSSGFVAHITYTTNMLSNGITSVYGGAVREPLKLASCLFGAAVICPRLLLLTMLVVPVVFGLLYLVSRSLKRVCQNLLERAMGLHHVMLESLNNIKTVQAYCREDHEQERFDKATLDMQRFTMRIVSFNALNRPLTELLALGMMSTAIVAGSYLVMNRATDIFGIQITSQPLGPASMIIFFGMLVGASDPVRKLASVIDGINTGAVAANLLYPMLDQTSQIVEADDAVTTARPHRSLKLEGVHFAYEQGNPILSDVSLEIPHGSTVAVVGANGSGKSSMINLLCRFYDPQGGRICLDDADIRQMKLKDLRGRIALVTQNTELFNEDLYYNIGYGSEGATRDQIITAARAAHAESFIENELPQRYETVIGQDGHRLSGGQRQRIALARALIRDPDILILDEATSQIDVESERLIFDTIRDQCQHRTVFFVTHRPGMLDIADIVLRFEDQKISVERGVQALQNNRQGDDQEPRLGAVA
ncbi:Lipid A export ATP-binding/permease protein MsbA [Stieleria maiorica]|uniref:Lipid A export ATP-binding/permease protein MsbA n=1 Tax=Stieleria maiorica TaxID=2795974 RepID=A0A5B9MQG1_9BACT|nr:ABC transporter ATP-binding protein [Stieleria maiorica]QEG02207.1 Lipid A export ATP-binding/permease protein MsbA [Stieleria maiorica]